MDEKLERDLVRENLSIASNRSRLQAYVIDDILISLLVVVAFWENFAALSQDMSALIQYLNSLFVIIAIMKVSYQTLFLTLYGATLGKMVAKIAVIEVDSFGKPSPITALSRSVVRIVSEMLFYFGFIWVFFNPARQTWHDKAGKTIVIDV
jgi:uncharacterized RDD family membrane protein YckC